MGILEDYILLVTITDIAVVVTNVVTVGALLWATSWRRLRSSRRGL